MLSSEARRRTAECFRLIDRASMPWGFEDHPRLLPNASAHHSVAPVVMLLPSSVSSEIVPEHFADLDRPLLPAGYRSSNLLSVFLTALEVFLLDIAPDVHPGDGLQVESLMSEVRGVRSRVLQRDKDFKGLTRQVRKPKERLQKAKASKVAHHQRLRVNAMEHRSPLHGALERTSDQWLDQIATSCRTCIEHGSVTYARVTSMMIALFHRRTVTRHKRKDILCSVVGVGDICFMASRKSFVEVLLWFLVIFGG